MNCHQNQKSAVLRLFRVFRVLLMALPDSEFLGQSGLPRRKRASLAVGADRDGRREAEGSEVAEEAEEAEGAE